MRRSAQVITNQNRLIFINLSNWISGYCPHSNDPAAGNPRVLWSKQSKYAGPARQTARAIINWTEIWNREWLCKMNRPEPSAPNLAAIQAKYTYRNPLLRYANRRFLETILSMLTGLGFETLLDVGCGEGVVFDLISQKFELPIIGMDYDPSRLESARLRQGRALLLTGDAHRLPFKDNSFDIVLALELFEHVGDPSQALAEVQRVTRRYLLASVPREPWWRLGNMARLKYLRDFGNTPEHINHWSLSGFKEFVARKFSLVDVRTPILWTFVLAQLCTNTI
jgi:SAM-dependent methyltransferase